MWLQVRAMVRARKFGKTCGCLSITIATIVFSFLLQQDMVLVPQVEVVEQEHVF